MKLAFFSLLSLMLLPVIAQATTNQDTIWVWKDTLTDTWTYAPFDSVHSKAINEQHVVYADDYIYHGTVAQIETWRMLPPDFDTTGKTLDSCAFCIQAKTTFTTIGTIDPFISWYDSETGWLDCLTTADTTPNLTSSYVNYCWVYGRVGDASNCISDPPLWIAFYSQAGYPKLIYGVKNLHGTGGIPRANYVDWAWLVAYSTSGAPPPGGNRRNHLLRIGYEKDTFRTGIHCQSVKLWE